MPRFQSIPDDYYHLLGVEPEAELREIEAAYWGFARVLRGQSAMAPYNEAYEVLANGERRRTYDADRVAPSPPPPPPVVEDVAEPDPPSTKFGWPAA